MLSAANAGDLAALDAELLESASGVTRCEQCLVVVGRVDFSCFALAFATNQS